MEESNRHDEKRNFERLPVNAEPHPQCYTKRTTERSALLVLLHIWSNKGFGGGVPANTETAAVKSSGCDFARMPSVQLNGRGFVLYL
jgi:hypothetical protein